ncbi:MAG TPA: hypothetical protein VGI85_16090 [Chthoniobacterales bacterium]
MQRKISIPLALLMVFGGGHLRAGTARSSSASRQFIVYGDDIRLRGAVCDLAETTKANLLRLLRLPDHWKTPLLINLEYPQTNLPEVPASHFDFSQTGYGLKLQLNLLVIPDLNGPEVQRELLRAILIEMIYRSRPSVAVGTRYAAPPDWLIDGVFQSMPGRNPDEAAQLLQTVVASDRITPLNEIVRQRRDLLEAPLRAIHDAYSMALLRLLVEGPNGRHKLAQYIADLPDAPNDPLADLQAHFPSTLGHSPAKWWSLSVARLSVIDRYEILSAAGTAQRLDRLLRFSIPRRDGTTREYSLAEFAAYLKLPASRPVLRDLSEQMLLLATRSHPSYHAIVQEYYQLMGKLARGGTHRVARQLARLASKRTVVEKQERSIEDYMNWYEGTQLEIMSGAFSDVLKSSGDAEELPRRRDSISVYLDSVEEQVR